MAVALLLGQAKGPNLMKLGFLASKNGSNMQAVIDACVDGTILASPSLLVCNNPKAMAATRARESGLTVEILNGQSRPDPDDLDRSIRDALQAHQINLVVLAGYIKRLGPCTLEAYANRILNIHPSLLPKFGGQGMYSIRVHEAVIQSGEEKTGATAHLVNENYDEGAILKQKSISVEPNETPESLQSRVLYLEHSLYPDTIAQIVSGKITLPSA